MVADIIKDTVAEFSALSTKERDAIRKKASLLSKKALWNEFIKYYYQAYNIALQKANSRKAAIDKKGA